MMFPLTLGLSVARELTEILIQNGKIDRQGLDRAASLGNSTGERLDIVLTRLGLVSEVDMTQALAEHLGIPVAAIEHYPDAPVLPDTLAPNFLRRVGVVPLEDQDDALVLAMADPLDHETVDAIRLLTGKPVTPWAAIPMEIGRALARLYGKDGDIDAFAADQAGFADRDLYRADADRIRDRAGEAPMVKLVDSLIADAVSARASDIHIEPSPDRLRLRLRIDGVLRDLDPPPIALRSAIVSRIKVMANLDIAERRLAQDGRIRTSVAGREIDIRVSCVPVQHGESVVLRLLDKSRGLLDFDGLGFAADTGSQLESMLGLSNGIVLVTGPTGSGKTTTLYAALQRLNGPERKIVTAEDPVEYELDGINQIQVKPAIGLSFATVLRAVLRQDPDVMMIGEIRDEETAAISIQAALTGHLVLSTLHTNNAAGAITRLLDMGVESYLLTSALKAVVAQRLVRTLCTECRAPETPDAVVLEDLGIDAGAALFRAVGCPSCSGTGYRGRSVVAECLPLDEGIRNLVQARANTETIAAAATELEFRTLRQDGLLKALTGVTSLEEVLRVSQAL